VLTEWLQHYTHGRPRRSLGRLAPEQSGHEPATPINIAEHRVRRRAILGGLTYE
jgi:putative transposase